MAEGTPEEVAKEIRSFTGGYLKELVGEPRYMAPLMFPIHLISELSRLVSLSMRLFGNVFAGEVLIGTMLALTTAAVFVLPLAFFVPAVFLGLELLFGAVQALVFALLTMTYITMAIAEHEGGHDNEHDRHGQIRRRPRLRLAPVHGDGRPQLPRAEAAEGQSVQARAQQVLPAAEEAHAPQRIQEAVRRRTTPTDGSSSTR